MLEREAMALLVSARGISYGMRRAALRRAGCALNVVAEPGEYVNELGVRGAKSLMRMIGQADETLEKLAMQDVQLLAYGDEGYPDILRQISKPPHLLFVWGDADLRAKISVGIVGTRHASDYGIRHTKKIAGELARRGVCVVSGLALGIDSAAHAGTVDAHGRTIAVLGGALDRFYPEENRELMLRILDEGGSVVSEYPMGMPPGRYSFLERNRIIAGLSHGVVVMEGPRYSGALCTANIAVEEGRDLFALPGDVDKPNSALPNCLIGEGAKAVTSANDVLELLDYTVPPRVRKKQRRNLPFAVPYKEEETHRERHAEKKREQSEEFAAPQTASAALDRIDERGKRILAALEGGETDFDTLCQRAGLGADELGGLLVMLELDGFVQSLPGLRYARA